MGISRPRYYKKQQRHRKKSQGDRFKRGYYKPINEGKYHQPIDKTMNQALWPEYRSSWEYKFYKWCDHNPDIDFWGTEMIAIRYLSPKDNKIHRYYPDVFVKFKDGRKIIIEIKPSSQVKWPVNQAKFAAAKEYADKIGAEFHIMTEKELGVK